MPSLIISQVRGDEPLLDGLDAITDAFVVCTADSLPDRSNAAIISLLKDVRQLLQMDIAFVSEFVGDQRVIRTLESVSNEPHMPQVNQGTPLLQSFCQRIIDGRLPRAIPDTSVLKESRDLAITKLVNIKAYLAAPIVLSDGRVYGTLCCISHQVRSALGMRQVDALHKVAVLVATEIDKY